MSKKKKIDTRGGGRTLAHNPFAALLPEGAASSPSSSSASPEPEAVETEAPLFAAKAVVRRETKGRGGKTVTRIAGVEAAHREELAGRMKKALGCGAVVEGEDILLLGSLVDRAADWLEAAGAKRVVRAR